MQKILVLHGPNLNMLGTREPNHYGHTTLEELNDELATIGTSHNIPVDCYQSNNESDLISKTQHAIIDTCNFMLINPGGYTHTSIAWRDAVLAVNIPFIEVHLSNVYARENFRHKSFFSDIAVGVISGLGKQSYTLALDYAIHYLQAKGV